MSLAVPEPIIHCTPRGVEHVLDQSPLSISDHPRVGEQEERRMSWVSGVPLPWLEDARWHPPISPGLTQFETPPGRWLQAHAMQTSAVWENDSNSAPVTRSCNSRRFWRRFFFSRRKAVHAGVMRWGDSTWRAAITGLLRLQLPFISTRNWTFSPPVDCGLTFDGFAPLWLSWIFSWRTCMNSWAAVFKKKLYISNRYLGHSLGHLDAKHRFTSDAPRVYSAVKIYASAIPGKGYIIR